ncbi:hypothetical protein EON63_10100 [archaeon]|nr:MAG: hypothetical protein EON63_10100 [archaeon]
MFHICTSLTTFIQPYTLEVHTLSKYGHLLGVSVWALEEAAVSTQYLCKCMRTCMYMCMAVCVVNIMCPEYVWMRAYKSEYACKGMLGNTMACAWTYMCGYVYASFSLTSSSLYPQRSRNPWLAKMMGLSGREGSVITKLR